MIDSSLPLIVPLSESERDRDFSRIGAKAESLVIIDRLGLPTPPAFFITREAFRLWKSGHITEDFWTQLASRWHSLEIEYGRIFPGRPLLASVRSSGPQSMPGIMDTLLYVGLTRETAGRLQAEFRSPELPTVLNEVLTQRSKTFDAWDERGAANQLRRAVIACWSSATTALASRYRERHSLDQTGDWTGVVVQGMVFGALGGPSGSGVVFSRNPISGARAPFGEWAPHQAGTSVVGGIQTPLSLDVFDRDFPALSSELRHGVAALERLRRDAQEVEFTVERRRLWFLQTRNAKRTAAADRLIVSDLSKEGVITQAEKEHRLRAVSSSDPSARGSRPADRSVGRVLSSGIAAAPGIGTGVAVSDVDEALRLHDEGTRVILVRETTAPEDLPGMLIAEAIVTARGGATSHAAVLARELGKPCVVGCGDTTVATLAGRLLVVDGSLGLVHELTEPV